MICRRSDNLKIATAVREASSGLCAIVLVITKYSRSFFHSIIGIDIKIKLLCENEFKKNMTVYLYQSFCRCCLNSTVVQLKIYQCKMYMYDPPKKNNFNTVDG